MLATFLDSDDCFMVYRRFGFLQSRRLLEKQEELRERALAEATAREAAARQETARREAAQ